MTTHTALLDLPAHLTNLGLNVVALDGWDEAQGAYFWTDPFSGAQGFDRPPSGYMVHHTAGSAATPAVGPPWSKANAWIGLDRGDGRLYQEGAGVPLIVIVSSGPARTSSGYGFRPAAWDNTFQDRRAPAHASGSDSTPQVALNRYAFNVETVHRGDGSLIDAAVWHHVVGLGIALHEMFGWNERTLGHTSWTRRKIDPRWSLGGMPNDGPDSIIDVQNAIADLGPAPPDPPDRPNGGSVYLPLTYGMGFDADPERQPDVEWMQRALYRAGLFDSRHGFDGKYGDDSADAVTLLHGPDSHNDGRTYGPVEHDLLLSRGYANGGGGYRAHIHKTDEGTPIE